MSAFKKMIEQEFGVIVEKEHKFHPKRRFRFDYAIVDMKIAIEKEGGVFTKGAHGSVTGIMRDMEKYNLATSNGWAIIRLRPDQMFTGYAIDLIRDTIKNHSK